MPLSPKDKLHRMAYEETNRCIQCGYCLPACPTYASMGRESASPRGRIHLVKLAAEGKIDVLKDMSAPLDLCLGCRACETACPVDVPYGGILEAAKEAIAEAQQWEPQAMPAASRIRLRLMRDLFPHPGRLRLAGDMLWLAQRLGLDRLARKSGLLRRIHEPLDRLADALPELEAPWKRLKRGGIVKAGRAERAETAEAGSFGGFRSIDAGRNAAPVKARIALFAGCVTDAVMSKTNRLTASLLDLVGCEVTVPAAQACCGALHAHQGLAVEARRLAERNIAAFESSGADYIVSNAGGCGAMLYEYGKLFPPDSEWRKRAERFAAKVKDISELLVQFGPLPFAGSWEATVTYQDSCHLRNVQKVSEAPRKLLQAIPGAHFTELGGCEQCCASGGIYNLVHAEESMKILDAKMAKVKETQATVVVTTNPGCLLQMRIGVRRSGRSDSIRTAHLVEVLAEACGLS